MYRGQKEKGFAYLRSNEPGSDPSSVTRCAVCPTPSLRFASRVQRESKCKRPKQTLKASWVGVKGGGMVKLRGGESRHTRKAKPIVFSTRVGEALLPRSPSPTLTSCFAYSGQSEELSPSLTPVLPYLGFVHWHCWVQFWGPRARGPS